MLRSAGAALDLCVRSWRWIQAVDARHSPKLTEVTSASCIGPHKRAMANNSIALAQSAARAAIGAPFPLAVNREGPLWLRAVIECPTSNDRTQSDSVCHSEREKLKARARHSPLVRRISSRLRGASDHRLFNTLGPSRASIMTVLEHAVAKVGGLSVLTSADGAHHLSLGGHLEFSCGHDIVDLG